MASDDLFDQIITDYDMTKHSYVPETKPGSMHFNAASAMQFNKKQYTSKPDQCDVCHKKYRDDDLIMDLAHIEPPKHCHKECFRCTVCASHFSDPYDFTVGKDGAWLCPLRCNRECAICGEVSQKFQVCESKQYCLACLKCHACRAVLEGTDFYEYKGRVKCPACMQKTLNREAAEDALMKKQKADAKPRVSPWDGDGTKDGNFRRPGLASFGGWKPQESFAVPRFLFRKEAGELCDRCGRAIIREAEVSKALGRRFHRDCFACDYCDKFIAKDQPSFEIEGRISCAECQDMMCSECEEVIEDRRQFVHFCGEHYHRHCFKCDQCGVKLNIGAYFELNEQKFCRKDYEAITVGVSSRPKPESFTPTKSDAHLTSGSRPNFAVPQGKYTPPNKAV